MNARMSMRTIQILRTDTSTLVLCGTFGSLDKVRCV